MFLTDREIKELNEKGLKDFLDKKIQEGYHLDYKRGLSGKSDKEQYREFLKDVTGFANANGGQIIIGAEEPLENLSIENQLVGVQQGDKLAMSLERVASSSIDPRIAGLQIKSTPLSIGNHAKSGTLCPKWTFGNFSMHVGWVECNETQQKCCWIVLH
jgi:hypothetical protein